MATILLPDYAVMRDDLPEDLLPDIRSSALPIVEKVLEAGWQVRIMWDSKSARLIQVSARSPSGMFILIACGECRLVGQLQSLLEKIVNPPLNI